MNALKRTGPRHDEDGARQTFASGIELLNTLLTGRVAESIRALSHHLLTPLQGAIADVDGLAERHLIPDEVQGRLERNLKEIDTAAKQIQILISDEAGVTAQRLRKVQVASMVASLVHDAAAEAQRRHIAIDHNQTNARDVQAVPDLLWLVLSNLFQNALKYSFDGSPGHDRVVKISYMPDRDRLVIRFQNEGCGIGDDEIAEGKLFELGYRGRMSGDRGRLGTGTGLYVVEKIASAHGAEVRVYSHKVGSPSLPTFQAYENRFNVIWPIYSTLSS